MKTAGCSAVCGSASGGKNSAFCSPGRSAPAEPGLPRRRQAASGHLVPLDEGLTWLPSAFLPGFTLLEIMIATALFGLVMAGTIEVYIMCNKIWHSTSISMQAARESSLALSRIVYGMGTNSGLRAAAMIRLNTNSEVHSHWDGTKYWETATNSPPSAVNPAHYVSVLGDDPHDNSWRLIVSNQSDGAKYIDYNVQERNILFCPDTNQTSAARQKRMLICNYVSAARVTTNASGTVSIQLTVEKRDGMFVASNTVSTSVKMRNKP